MSPFEHMVGPIQIYSRVFHVYYRYVQYSKRKADDDLEEEKGEGSMLWL